MATGNQIQTKPTASVHQNANQSQTSQTSSAAPQTSPLARDFFIQMQRTAGNRATQAYANQFIQRTITPAPLPTVQTPTPAATQAQGTVQPAPGIAPSTTVTPLAPGTSSLAPATATATASCPAE